jgi:hypothetical protein
MGVGYRRPFPCVDFRNAHPFLTISSRPQTLWGRRSPHKFGGARGANHGRVLFPYPLIYLPVIGPSDEDPHRQKLLVQVGAICVAPICGSLQCHVAHRRIPGVGQSARGQVAFRERQRITGRYMGQGLDYRKIY